MIIKGDNRVTSVELFLDRSQRILSCSFANKDRKLGRAVTVGGFLTTAAFDECFTVLARIILMAGFRKYGAYAKGSRTDNLFIYRLPPDYGSRFLRRYDMPVKWIEINAPHLTRVITIAYATLDPDNPDQNMFFEDKDELPPMTTLIDFEFMVHAIRHFFLLHQGYQELVHTCRYNKVIPDHFVIEYKKQKTR